MSRGRTCPRHLLPVGQFRNASRRGRSSQWLDVKNVLPGAVDARCAAALSAQPVRIPLPSSLLYEPRLFARSEARIMLTISPVSSISQPDDEPAGACREPCTSCAIIMSDRSSSRVSEPSNTIIMRLAG
eukprot:scaffold9332_cov113-Isochrysis_galbana.AAC.2